MKTFKQSGEVLPVIAPYDVQRGSGVLIGQLFGLACATVNAGTSVDIMCKGEFVVDKVTTEAWAPGDKIYWNSSSKKFSNVGGGGLLVGLASESAVNPSLLGSLLLTQQPGLVDPVFNAVTGGLVISAGGSDSFYVNSTPGPVSSYIAVIGDSTARGVYGDADSEPGISYAGVVATVFVAGDSWITWASVLSGGQIQRITNASVTGNTIAMMLARVQADVIGRSQPPKTCIVYSGYNDASAGVTPELFIADYKSLVNKLVLAGITPILATCLPTVNNAPIAGLMVQYSLAIRNLAAKNGFVLLDFQSWAMDSATGGLVASVGSGGDGVHPSAAGQKVLGQRVFDALAPLLTPCAKSLQISPLDVSNIAPNGLFVGAPVSGLAPNVFNVTPAAGATDSVVSDALVPGMMQRCTHSGSTVTRIQGMRIAKSGKWSAGDVLEISGVVTRSGIKADVGIEFACAPYNQRPIALNADVTRGYFCSRIRVPLAIAVEFIDIHLKSGPGTGYADFGQITVRNLTVLGLV